MAVAKKCDVCGCLYEVYTGANGFMLWDSDKDVYTNTHSYIVIDCCLDCIQKVKDFAGTRKKC